MTRSERVWVAVALAVLLLELGATIGSLAGEPFAPVAGWARTRPADAIAFVTVVIGCAALARFGRNPLTVAIVSTAAYAVFALRNHDLGMFLPPMVVAYALVTLTRHRLAALVCALASYAAALVWIAERTIGIDDPGTAIIARVALGTVIGVFLFAPLLVGEIVRLRRLLRAA